MDAKEFIRELVRLCKSQDETCGGCKIRQYTGCPLTVPENVDADILVAVVEKWSKENPVVTNGDEVMKLLPVEVKVYDEYTDDVTIRVPRKWWDAEYKEGSNDD